MLNFSLIIIVTESITLYNNIYALAMVMKTKPIRYNTNITNKIRLVPAGAPLNSFQANTPQRMATTGAALLRA
jgi:hypothetical protein